MELFGRTMRAKTVNFPTEISPSRPYGHLRASARIRHADENGGSVRNLATSMGMKASIPERRSLADAGVTSANLDWKSISDHLTVLEAPRSNSRDPLDSQIPCVAVESRDN